MGRVCKEVHEWIEETIEKPIEEWENKQKKKCKKRKCKWYCLCCNKWFCWLVWVLVKVIRWVTVTVGKWVSRVVCEVVSFILDVAAFFASLIFLIPAIGTLLRILINTLREVILRIFKLPELLLSLLGFRPRKKMYFGVIIPSTHGRPIATVDELEPLVNRAIEIYDRRCNISLRFTGYCHTDINPPYNAPIEIKCSANGFFKEWGVLGSWFQLVSQTCKFRGNWRRVTGIGGEVLVFIIHSVHGEHTAGCSMGITSDWVVVEAGERGPDIIAHEMSHSCGLRDRKKDAISDNLMADPPYELVGTDIPVLTPLQIAVIRTSRHVVFI